MTYKKGQRVRHPKKADWGLGEVLEDATDAADGQEFLDLVSTRLGSNPSYMDAPQRQETDR
ncbi:MAG: DUF3553 domain-containing protein [Nitrososphaera sp.]